MTAATGKPGTLVRVRKNNDTAEPFYQEGRLGKNDTRLFWRAFKTPAGGWQINTDEFHNTFRIPPSTVWVEPTEAVMVMETYGDNYILFSQERTFWCHKDNFDLLFEEIS